MFTRSGIMRLAAPAAGLLAVLAAPPAPLHASQPASPDAIPVRIQTVRLGAPIQAQTYSGTIQARIQADLAFRVAGKVLERPVNAGDRVKQGQLLARLDPTDYQLNLEVAAQAIAAAEADAANARAELARYTRLGAASAAYLPAESDRRSAAARSSQARLAQAQRQLILARDQLAYTQLRADADGAIAALPVQVGQVVSAGQTVAMLAHGSEIEAAVDVPENHLADIRSADEVTVTLWSDPDHPLRGRVREIGALADAASRTFSVKVTLLDVMPEGAGLGLTATARFARHRAAGAIALLPASALSDVEGRPAVWVLKAGHAALRPIQVAALAGDGSVAVSAGLADGDQVVTAGVDALRPDVPVRAWEGAEH